MPRQAAGSSRQDPRKVQPPRPPNAWILYRSSKFALIRQSNERLSQAAVSKRISYMWKNEAEDIKRHFERMAEDKKAEHQALYPDYRFCPKRKEVTAQTNADRKQKKKSKTRDATPTDTDADVEPTPPMPAPAHAPPPMLYMPQAQPYFVPGYQHNLAMPQNYMVHYPPEAQYGPGGPSPPISAAPSPTPYESSQSLEAHPYPEENVASSSSSQSGRPSPSSESQASSSSSQLNPLYFSSLPSSHQPSPNPYPTQPLPTLLFQPPVSAEMPLTPLQGQLPSPDNTVALTAPVWNSQNSEAVVHFDVPINQTQDFSGFQQSLSNSSSLESLQGMISRTDENGVFNLSNIDSSDLMAYPQGDLEVAMGHQAPTVDYNQELFADFDLAEFERQMAAFAESNSSSTPAVPPSVEEDLQSLFHTPHDPEIQAYTMAQQCQPSVFTQDMMSFFNFEAAEGSIEETPTVSPPPIPTTVAPQQVRFQSTQHAAAMPIFTQMTNTPTVAATTSYVPPAGAIYSSTRRVGGSWKPTFTNLPSQADETVQFQSWSLT